MWLALVTVPLSVVVADAAPVRGGPPNVVAPGVRTSRPVDAHLTADGSTPSVSPTPGASPGRQTSPGASTPRILVGAALLLAAFLVLIRRRGQIRRPPPHRGEADPDRPETPEQGQPPDTSL